MRSRKLVFWGLCFAATMAAAPFLFAKFTGGFDAYAHALSRVPASTWASAAAATAFFYFLDWVRFYSLLAIFGFKLRLRTGIRLTCVSYFVSSLTPSAELHLPAMVLLLVSEGVEVGVATAVTITKSMYMTLWICAIAWVSLNLQHDVHLPAHLARNLHFYLLPFAGLIGFLGAIVLFPKPIHRWAEKVLARKDVAAWKHKVVGGIDHAAQALVKVTGSTHHMHWICHAASATFVFVYCLIGWLLVNGVGIPLAPGKAVTVFSNGLMMAYLSPIPGSVGVTEVFTSYLLDPKLTSEGMAAVLTHRILCWYVVIVPGIFLLFSSLRKVKVPFFPSGRAKP